MRDRYDIEVTVLSVPPADPPLWQNQPGCCGEAKVAQLDRGLAPHAAWLSGLRRVEAATRESAPIVSRDRRGLVKVNPLANWSDGDVAGYIAEHDVPVNPLVQTGLRLDRLRPVHDAGHRRRRSTGRPLAWPQQDQCGIHLD